MDRKNMKAPMEALEAIINKESGRKYVSSAELCNKTIFVTNFKFMEQDDVKFIVALFDDKFTLTFHEQPMTKMRWLNKNFGQINVRIRIKSREDKKECNYELI